MKLAPTLTLLMLASAPAFSFTASVDFNNVSAATLKGQGSGIGFEPGSDWSSGSSAIKVADDDLAAPAYTNYGLSQSTGSGLVPRHVYAQVSTTQPFDDASSRQNGRNLESTISSGTVWISFLAAAPTGTDTSWAGVGLDPSASFSGFSNSPLIGVDSTGSLFYSSDGFNLDPGTFISGVASSDGSANLVLASFDLDAGTLSVWVNPDVDNRGVADLTSSELGTIASTGISRIGVGGVNSGEIDAVYLSNDVDAYQQVTGSSIPEPATWAAMAGVLALAIAAMRRRR